MSKIADVQSLRPPLSESWAKALVLVFDFIAPLLRAGQ